MGSNMAMERYGKFVGLEMGDDLMYQLSNSSFWGCWDCDTGDTAGNFGEAMKAEQEPKVLVQQDLGGVTIQTMVVQPWNMVLNSDE